MNYQQIYDDFIAQYTRSETSPSEAGEVLARIAALYPNFNMAAIQAERAFAIVRKNVVEGTDDQTGKAMSSAKADTIADASDEAFAYKTAKGHVANIEMLIGALKFLQKSLETEYINSNL